MHDFPDFSHDGNKSSYEMREGRKPSKEDLPRTLYSTVYWKNPDATNNKIGNPSIGINCGAVGMTCLLLSTISEHIDSFYCMKVLLENGK